MKTLYLIILASLALNANSQSLLLYSQDRDLYELNINNCELRKISDHQFNYNDIAFHQDNNLYAITHAGRLDRIDTLNSLGEFVFMFEESGFVGLTSSKDGILYATTQSGNIWSYDIESEVADSIGNIDINCGGDITFYNGELHYAGVDNEILRIDLDSLENSSIIMPSVGSGGIWGLTSVKSDCHEETTYAVFASSSTNWTVVRSINYSDSSYNTHCIFDEIVIFGSTSYSESFNSSLTLEELKIDSMTINPPECDSMNGSIEVFGSGNGTLLYSINGQSLSGNNIFEGLNEQLYFLEIHDQLGCELDTIIDLTCTNTTSSFNISEFTNSFNLYPNPSSGLIYIEMNLNPALKLYSLAGIPQQIKSQIEGNRIKIDISHLMTGIYFLSINNSVTKIVKY